MNKEQLENQLRDLMRLKTNYQNQLVDNQSKGEIKILKIRIKSVESDIKSLRKKLK